MLQNNGGMKEKSNYTNDEIAKLFRNIAASYVILDEKKFRFQIIAYQKAADSIEASTIQLQDLYNDDRLTKIEGIGSSMIQHLEELFKTGKVKHFEQVLSGVPEAVFPLLDIPSFGPKKAYRLVDTFKLKNPDTVIDDVLKIAEDNRISELEGFGKTSQTNIIQAITEYRQGTTKSSRMVLPYAYELANRIVTYLKESKDCIEATPLGSLRRMKSTIGDVDIAVTSDDPKTLIEYFINYPHKERVIEKGEVSASILLSGGKHVDLLVLNPKMWGSLLQHFTGSKEHNVSLREYALSKELSLSERGIKEKKTEKMHTFSKEEDFYRFLGLSWIPPEIRENQGEIELAKKNQLPDLLELGDIKGDIHIHSNYPIDSSHDYGSGTMQEHIDKAKKLGYAYIGFSEHNPKISDRTDEQIFSILKKRYENIEQLRKSNKSIRIINLLETDILASEALAIPESSMELVDALIVSVHSSFSSDVKKMTDRVLKGLSHPKVKALCHPTGRLLNQRNGYTLDWEKVFDFCVKNNKALEINSWPERLDLPDSLVKQAKEAGVKFVINTDSHAVSHMDNMFYGVAVARRGWCEKKDVLNTLPTDKFLNWILK